MAEDARRLILDTDGGVDDAQALLLLIGAGRVPAAITTSFGNVELDAATDNVLATLAVAGVDVPVHAGAADPIAGDRIHAHHVHGEDGLADAPRPDRVAAPASRDGVGFLVDTFLSAAAAGERVDLVTIGPLTNLALALQRAPGIVAGIGDLTVMGGTLTGRGNVTPAAEFNVFADPEAAATVFAARLATTVVPWETCLRHGLDGDTIDRLLGQVPDGPYRRFVSVLLANERERHARQGLGDVLLFIDPLAAAVAIRPALVASALQACVGVSLAPGIARGMTVVDPSGRLQSPPLSLVEAVDLPALADLFGASLVSPRLFRS